MSDISPYGVTQHADGEMVTADQLVGEHAGSVTEHQGDPRFSRAMFSTAPVRKPMTTPTDARYNVRTCARDGCNAIAKKESDHCRWHQP